MAKTMTAAVAVPHLYYTEDIKVDALIRLKDGLKDMTFESGVKLTYLPFLLKALSLSLKQYPIMNSTVNEDVSEITLRGLFLQLRF
jgi:2-oxoisovalerate dehydrogenase E2 component (dihydrolipoyl transacylase)